MQKGKVVSYWQDSACLSLDMGMIMWMQLKQALNDMLKSMNIHVGV